ncbi:MAG: rhodanese-like domain-containing protein [Rhodobacteraceae bacterium]|nr:rhodanese-like domain-containing protein [Paracoccaceae bacterium]
MRVTVQEMMQVANAVVKRVDGATAQQMLADGAVMIDLRDGAELVQTGKATGALHISRGMLEFRADPASPLYHEELRFERPVVLHCASGGRAALAGKLLLDMGYETVVNLGGFKDWIEAGGSVDT